MTTKRANLRAAPGNTKASKNDGSVSGETEISRFQLAAYESSVVNISDSYSSPEPSRSDLAGTAKQRPVNENDDNESSTSGTCSASSSEEESERDEAAERETASDASHGPTQSAGEEDSYCDTDWPIDGIPQHPGHPAVDTRVMHRATTTPRQATTSAAFTPAAKDGRRITDEMTLDGDDGGSSSSTHEAIQDILSDDVIKPKSKLAKKRTKQQRRRHSADSNSSSDSSDCGHSGANSSSSDSEMDRAIDAILDSCPDSS